MIDFLKYRYACMVVSAVLLISGAAAFFYKGGFRYHIEFEGGTEILLAFEKPIEIGELRTAVDEKKWGTNQIQSIGSDGHEFLVRIGLQDGDIESSFKKTLSKAIDNTVTIRSIEQVGAEAGKEVKTNAIIAILLSLLVLLLYLSIRSKFAYATGAVAALAHDLLIIAGFLIVTGIPVSLNVLAAVVVILGYSLNDTIVIFSRIRENIGKLRGRSSYEIANVSLNQTLRRTLLTSFSTFVSVLTLYLLGGEALSSFALVTLVGVIFGTYSSIYIASPVMLALNQEAL